MAENSNIENIFNVHATASENEPDIEIKDGDKQQADHSTYLDLYKSYWDPLTSFDWDHEKPSVHCLHRVKKDVYHLYEDPAPGICIVPDTDNITKIHALINGPFDTPYEGGFFYFVIRCPPTYPFKPPRVRIMTTSNGTVRFNPNLYKTGKVCLSILGTWTGPAWLPSQSIASLLMSIQSLLSSNPYFNEPGFEKETVPNAVKFYNEIIRHETLRVAVCENLENLNTLIPECFRGAIEESFLEQYEFYVETCKANLEKDKELMTDLLYNEIRGKFKYAKLLERLGKIKEAIDMKRSAEKSKSVSRSSSMNMEDFNIDN